MKYVINPDLVWSKSKAYSELITFCGHLTCSGHPHVTMGLYSRSCQIVVFMDSYDDLGDVLEVSEKYLSLKWSVDPHKPEGGDDNACWVIFTYLFYD